MTSNASLYNAAVIKTVARDAIRELRLDRPPVNALSPELMNRLQEAITAAPQEGALGIVLSGAPGIFSAGLDVPLLLTFDRPGIAAVWRDFYGLLRTIVASPVPIAAAITGHAPAGGTVLSLFCDWRVLAQGDWKLGLNEVQVGLRLPPIVHSALSRQVGPRQAERLAVSGALLSPAEALAVGMVDELAPPEQVGEQAMAWCQKIASLPREAMSATRMQARADLVALFEQDFDRELDDILDHWFRAETQSVLRALVARIKKG